MDMRFIPLALIVLSGISGCSTFTGLPSHGGGKRFSIEQELISASARASALSLDLSALKGKNCALFLTTMGDQGGGNLVGGRYQWQGAIRGSYVANPTTTSQNQFPLLDSTTTTRDGVGAVLSEITSRSPVNFPGRTDSQQRGEQVNAGGGVGFSGTPEYAALGFINPNDVSFLSAVVREACVLQGIGLTSPQNADATIYVTVDVFGTHRSRTEMHIYNQERLRAKTAMHVTAFDKKGKVIMPPQTVSFEADYRERYVFWCGPLEVEKRVYASDDLMIDFSCLVNPENLAPPKEIDSYEEELPPSNARESRQSNFNPFRKFVPDGQGERGSGGGRTRPNELIRPRTAPDPSRVEDVLPELQSP